MNRFIYTIMALPALLLPASCNHALDSAHPGAVNILATINGAQTRAPQLDSDGSGTFQDKDELKLAIYGSNATPMQATYTIGNHTLYWADVVTALGQSGQYTFAAWYNGDSSLDLVANPSFNVVNATDKDLLLAKPATAAIEQTVNLDFSHAMHKLVVKLSYGAGFETLDKTQVTVTPKSMNAAAAVDVKAGTVTVGEANDAKGEYAARKMDENSNYTFTFILPPQKLTTGEQWLDINLNNGMKFSFDVPATYTDASGNSASLSQLNSGQVMTLNLTVAKTGVSLTTGQIAAWGNQGSYTGNADYVYE